MNCSQCNAPVDADGLCTRGHLRLDRRGLLRGLAALTALAVTPRGIAQAVAPKIIVPERRIFQVRTELVLPLQPGNYTAVVESVDVAQDATTAFIEVNGQCWTVTYKASVGMAYIGQ